jgi:hypothetical protein
MTVADFAHHVPTVHVRCQQFQKLNMSVMTSLDAAVSTSHRANENQPSPESNDRNA